MVLHSESDEVDVVTVPELRDRYSSIVEKPEEHAKVEAKLCSKIRGWQADLDETKDRPAKRLKLNDLTHVRQTR
jgi:hypothetical protein